MIAEQYYPQKLEKQIQEYWKKNKTFEVTEDPNKEKFYSLVMFPYPSGRLHIGHVRVYTLNDVIARYQRLLHKNVLQPMGWDAFGLPAENAAIKQGVPPAQWTYDNIKHMRHQFDKLGYGYDWSREITTCKPDYYRWEQWLFIKMLEKGLVYRKDSMVNWDPVDQTVLANEQVIDGRGWRSGALIEQRRIPQWFFKITDYAEELLQDLDTLTGWSEHLRTMQRNWIGKSQGVEMTFDVKDHDIPLTVYTTRADTSFGITFIAIATEHPLTQEASKNNPELQKFIEACRHTKVSEVDIETLEKAGIDSGFVAINPLTQEEIPIWVTNYVLMEYGSGAVMAVPAHDQRDFEFAKKYQLPIKEVIKPLPSFDISYSLEKQAFVEKGVLVNSVDFTGLTSEEAVQAIADYLIQHQHGRRKTNYRLRDWSISRQRYWGAPIPIIYCEDCGAVPVPLEDLPVVLPEDVKFQGTSSPLGTMPSFYEVKCPQCGKLARRETDTFDTFVESSWYYTRYTCPDQDKKILDERVKYWLPVDQYVGGIEHAVMHLLYSRFFHKVMRNFGLVEGNEPFSRLLNQGMVLQSGEKMSKSKGNIVDPDELIATFGADTVRFFMIFASPPEQTLDWADTGVEGAHRFIKRIWNFAYNNQQMIKNFQKSTTDWEKLSSKQKEIRQQLHILLKQANYDMIRQQFNTVASACMKLFNLLVQIQESDETDTSKQFIHEGLDILLRLLNPITPHFTKYLWEELGYGPNMDTATWPETIEIPEEAIQVTLAVQVNGKLRAQITVPQNTDQKTVEKMALADEHVQKFIANKTIKNMIVVPNRVINIVI
jgi:leucyl-tRNA synthetase